MVNVVVAYSEGRCHAGGRRGTTLIELVGVIAVLTVLLMAVAGGMIRRMVEERQRAEAQRMEEIGGAFRRAVAADKQIPGTNRAAWSAAVAVQLGTAADLVESNRAGGGRILVYDPGFNVGGVGASGLPFRQQGAGVTNVLSPRLVIVSALEPGLPTAALNTQAGFSNLWNRADRQLPAGWPAGWPADPENLFVQRVDLSDLFHEITLNNVDGYSSAPYAVLTNRLSGTGYANAIPTNAPPVSTHLLHGTPLRLDYGDGTVQSMVFVTEAASYTFESGRWNRHALAGINGPTSCGLLGQYVEQFINHPDWGVTDIGTDPASAVLAMFDTLWGGTDWANAGFEDENGHSKWETPTARFLYDVAPQLMLTGEDLIE
ncbi:MAG: type II secretion system protein [Verrucomicrobiales bacterium]|nr:type II secretion system protein [Verrucomicrobiales bacterium]